MMEPLVSLICLFESKKPGDVFCEDNQYWYVLRSGEVQWKVKRIDDEDDEEDGVGSTDHTYYYDYELQTHVRAESKPIIECKPAIPSEINAYLRSRVRFLSVAESAEAFSFYEDVNEPPIGIDDLW